MVDTSPVSLSGPHGPKPRKALSRRNIFLYGTLFVITVYYALPLYVMIVTSLKGMPEIRLGNVFSPPVEITLKGMPEIRLGNVFSPPVEITFQPWVKAWSEACTGLTCNGLSTGFWNSVQITIPSVILSIIIASVNGYALANWRFKGADVFFTILIFGAFIPYQVMLYPIVIMLREVGLYGSLWGLVLVHTVFGMPILTLLFRNYFTSLPEELFKAARVDGAGFWGILFYVPTRRAVQSRARRRGGVLGDLPADHGAHVATNIYRRNDLAGHRHLERFPVRGRLHRPGNISHDRFT